MKFEYHKCQENKEEYEIWAWVGLNCWHILIRYESMNIKYCPFCGILL